MNHILLDARDDQKSCINSAHPAEYNVHRLATVDMRIDYIAPGRGRQFIGSAEVLRMGRKGCTTRMNMHNDEGKLIATGNNPHPVVYHIYCTVQI
jgi:acyl-coenzyme A thioesterase PaaI-like protein